MSLVCITQSAKHFTFLKVPETFLLLFSFEGAILHISGGDSWAAHLFPSRTQKLSAHTPTVLGWRRPGRLGSCRFASVRVIADVPFMAGVVKWLTHWIVAPARMGSIPIARPILQGYSSIGRVVVSKTIGCGFKSYCPCQRIHDRVIERLRGFVFAEDFRWKELAMFRRIL